MLPTEVTALRQSLRQQILTIDHETSDQNPFESLALAVFQYQATYNLTYRDYLHHLGVQPDQVTELRQVPFMPIDFFKNHSILSGLPADVSFLTDTLTFASSGTTGRHSGSEKTTEVPTSRHFVPDPDLYNAVSTRIFEQTYGPLSNFHILALLPSYLERNNSSLVYMVQRFMAQTGSDQSAEPTGGFFLNNHDELTHRLRKLVQQPDQKKILLIGVTFGLLDWAESSRDLSFLGSTSKLIVMETGGMKGRRQELLREEVHEILIRQLGIQTVHSEYGMTELLSQAYSPGEGVFRPSPTLRVFLRDINDPFLIYPRTRTGSLQTESLQTGSRQTGGINVVDLANLDSCAFIETQDLGQYVGENGNFRVIGRFDNSDIRGCNLMVI